MKKRNSNKEQMNPRFIRCKPYKSYTYIQECLLTLHEERPCHIPLIFTANQWIVLYMIEISVMNELILIRITER